MSDSRECPRMRRLLPLRPTEDLTVEECDRVDQHVRHCAACAAALMAHSEALKVLRESALVPTLLVPSKPLWDRLEPRLGPAGRMRRRSPLARISTPQLVAACAALFLFALVLEVPKWWRTQQPIANERIPMVARTAVNDEGPRIPLANELPRPMMGIVVHDVDERWAEQLRLRAPIGVVVLDILEGSSAHEAGVRVGDTWTALNGKEIESAAHLAEMLTGRAIGERIQVDFVRHGRLLRMEIRLGIEPEIKDLPIPLPRRGPWPTPRPITVGQDGAEIAMVG